MDNQGRIDRMERDGVLSPSQAVRLRDSVAGGGGLDDGEQAGAGRRRPVGRTSAPALILVCFVG